MPEKDELEKLLDGDQKKTEAPASGDKPNAEKTEEEKAAERLSNINKAIEEANGTLRAKRKAIKDGKTEPEDDDELKIDLNDPNSKAWDKHIKEKVDPLQDELAREKEEIRTFALKRFLANKPELAKDPESLKKVMETYSKIRTATERTTEGVLIDLRRAYAAEFSDEILARRQAEELDEAEGSAIFSEPAISRGSSYIPSERQKTPHLSKDDELTLAKWGMTAAEWVKMKTDQEKTNK